HRVEGSRDRLARTYTRIDPHPWAHRSGEDVEPSGRGHELPARAFAVDPELEAVPAHRSILVSQRFSPSDPELPPHHIDPGHLVAHRVLDLPAGGDLQEADRAVRTHQELTGPGTFIVRRPQDRLRGLIELLLLLGREERRRRLLDELLVPALERAVASRDHHDSTLGVREALRLDMPGCIQV